MHIRGQLSVELEEGIRSLEAGNTRGCESLALEAGNKTQVLRKRVHFLNI